MKKKTNKNINKWKHKGISDFVHETISHKIARLYAKYGENHKKEITLPLEFMPYIFQNSYNSHSAYIINYMGYKIYFD